MTGNAGEPDFRRRADADIWAFQRALSLRILDLNHFQLLGYSTQKVQRLDNISALSWGTIYSIVLVKMENQFEGLVKAMPGEKRINVLVGTIILTASLS